VERLARSIVFDDPIRQFFASFTVHVVDKIE
jgi:hypothetical protein